MLKVATVFTGIGAFEQALYKLKIPHEIQFACDIDKYVKKSYLANYQTKEWFDDVFDINTSNYKNKVDIFVGGSPCQSFSIVGNRKGFEDPRGNLIFKFIDMVDEIQPNVFIFENVVGLLTHNKGETFEIVKQEFSKLGYCLHSKVLNALSFGIPQSRKRIFIIGFKQKRKFEFPNPVELKITLQDLLVENPEEKYFLTEKGVTYFWKERGGGFNKNPVFDQPIAKTLLTRGHNPGQANYVTKNGRLRILTPRERLRLMGFSDNFKIVVSDTQIFKQTGNSIVVNVLEALIKQIYN